MGQKLVEIWVHKICLSSEQKPAIGINHTELLGCPVGEQCSVFKML